MAEKKTSKGKAARSRAYALHDKRYPGETPRYRAARNALLDAEVRLRNQMEAVAAMRRQLPPGGAVEDYVFQEAGPDGAARPVRLTQLFAPGKDTLVLYSFMYAPGKQACTLCTSLLDGVDGQAPHITQQVNLAVVAKSPVSRLAEFARDRGWRNLRLLSAGANDYSVRYLGESEDGVQMPMLNVFARRDGKIHHTYGTELLYTRARAGEDTRHVDLIWPLWNVLDFTPQGRGRDWYPRLRYD